MPDRVQLSPSWPPAPIWSCPRVLQHSSKYVPTGVARWSECLPASKRVSRSILIRENRVTLYSLKNTYPVRILIKIRLAMQIRIRIEKELSYGSGSAFSHTLLLVMKRSIKWYRYRYLSTKRFLKTFSNFLQKKTLSLQQFKLVKKILLYQKLFHIFFWRTRHFELSKSISGSQTVFLLKNAGSGFAPLKNYRYLKS